MGRQKVPRSHVEAPTAAGKNGSSLVELSHCAYLESCSRRKLLTERVENITPLSSGRNDAIDESAPITKKRRKIDEKAEENSCHGHARNVTSRQTEGLSSSLSTSSSDDSFLWDSEMYWNDEFGDVRREMDGNVDSGKRDADGINQPVSRDLGGSDELGLGRREKSDNGDGGRKDAGGINQPMFRGLGRSDELGDGRREMNDNGDGGRKDANGINWPMFKDLGGMDRVIRELKRDVIAPLYQSKLLRHLGVEPMARILLHGPRGCGKTTLARAVANEAGLPFYEISASELVSGVSGSFEDNIRELFSKACLRAPSIVFIDEIDALKEIEPHIVNRLMACMDESCRLIKPVNHDTGSESTNSTPGYVLAIGATSRPDAVDPVLRRRFDREIVLGIPDERARHKILSVLTCNLKVQVGCDLTKIARCTMGFVGRDLAALAKEAGILAVNRIMSYRNYDEGNHRPLFSDEEMEKFSIIMADFERATRMVQPSSKIEEFYTIPNAKWDDVVGLQSLKPEFDCHIIRPIKFPDVYRDLGMNSTTTFFLYGPSGCGKTLIVEALANEAGANFMHIKCPELLNKYADHSKLVLPKIFSNARTWSPCILFFDEMEALTAKPNDVLRQVVFKLKNAEERRGVYIICATNRPHEVAYMFDFTGKKRFDKCMYVPPPSPEERGMILKALSGNKPIDANVDLMALGKDVAFENFSGADLSTLMKEAAMGAIKRRTLFDGGRSMPIAWTIKDADFKRALQKISPTVSPMNLADYKSFSEQGFLGCSAMGSALGMGSFARLMGMAMEILDEFMDSRDRSIETSSHLKEKKMLK